MIFETTITLKREHIINDSKRNAKSVYCLSEESRQVGLELYSKAITDYETTVANVEPTKAKPKSKAKAKVEIENN